MDILDYFNVYNVDHLKAYRFLEDTGSWPVGFLLEEISFCTGWQIKLAGKMATAWANHDHSVFLDIGVDEVDVWLKEKNNY